MLHCFPPYVRVLKCALIVKILCSSLIPVNIDALSQLRGWKLISCKIRMMKSKKFNLNTESRSSCGFVMYNTPTVTTPSVPAPSSFNSNDSIPTPELPNLSQSNLLPPTAERQPSNNSRIGSHGHSRHLRFGGNSFTSTNSWLEKGQTEEEKKQFVKETLDSLRKIDLEEDCWVYY